jgi:hypothetical protein
MDSETSEVLQKIETFLHLARERKSEGLVFLEENHSDFYNNYVFVLERIRDEFLAQSKHFHDSLISNINTFLFFAESFSDKRDYCIKDILPTLISSIYSISFNVTTLERSLKSIKLSMIFSFYCVLILFLSRFFLELRFNICQADEDDLGYIDFVLYGLKNTFIKDDSKFVKRSDQHVMQIFEEFIVATVSSISVQLVDHSTCVIYANNVKICNLSIENGERIIDVKLIPIDLLRKSLVCFIISHYYSLYTAKHFVLKEKYIKELHGSSEEMSLIRIDQYSSANKLLSRNLFYVPASKWKECLSFPHKLRIDYHEFEPKVTKILKLDYHKSDETSMVLLDPEDATNTSARPKKLQNFMFFSVLMTDLSLNGFYEALNSDLTAVGRRQKDLLVKQIEKLHEMCQKNSSFYAPFTSLVQSSGSGKSKICLEVLREHFGVYLVFRKTTDSGIPQKTTWSDSFVNFVFGHDASDDTPIKPILWKNSFAKEYSTGRVLMALNLVIETYFAEIENIKNEQKLSEIDAVSQVAKSMMQRPTYSITKLLDDLSFEKLNDDLISLADIITKLSNTVSKLLNSKKFPFLFFVDEADLLNEFSSKGRVAGINVLRRALHLLDIDTNILVLAIGTNSDALDFTPSIRDNSLRFYERKNLLLPLFLPANWDIFSTEYPLQDIKVSRKLLLNSNMFKILTMLGRPLWASCSLDSVVKTAMDKLKNGEQFSLAALMALLLVRARASVNVHHVFARTLVRSYMTIVKYVSTDAKSIAIEYSSEPVLAMAARNILFGTKRRLQAFLAMRSLIRFQAIDVGRTVEYMFEHICLFSIDDAVDFEAKVNDVLTSFPLPKIENVLEDVEYAENENIAVEGDRNMDIGGNGTSTKSVVASIFGVESHVLELRQAEGSAPTTMPEPIHGTKISSSYRVIEVAHFILTLFGKEIFESVASFIPSSMLHGLVNSSHFINLLREREGDFDDLMPARAEAKKPAPIIDKALLKCGMLRQAAYVMPPNYNGIDFIVPFMYERSGSIGPVYSYIAIQAKASSEPIHDCAVKMDMREHLIKCPNCLPSDDNCPHSPVSTYTDEEYRELCDFQLSFLMTFSGGRRATSARNSKVQLCKKNVTSFPIDSASTLSPTVQRRVAKNEILAGISVSYPILAKFNCGMRLSAYPKLKSAHNKPDLIANRLVTPYSRHAVLFWDSVEGSATRQMHCLVAQDLACFTSLLDPKLMICMRDIVYNDTSTLDNLHEIHENIVKHSLIDGSFSPYSQCNPLLRSLREQPLLQDPLPKYFESLNDYTLTKSIERCILEVADEPISDFSSDRFYVPEIESEEETETEDEDEEEMEEITEEQETEEESHHRMVI